MNSNTPFPNVMKPQPIVSSHNFLFRRIAAVLFAALFCAGSAFAQTLLGQTQLAGDQAQSPASYTFKALNYPGASSTSAYGISNADEVVGYYTGAGCSQASCGFAFSEGKYTSAGCALAGATDFFDISHTTGEIVGAQSGIGNYSGFIYGGESLCNGLDPFGATYNEAWGVNDKGEVVGWYIDTNNAYQGFTYTPNGVYTNLTCFGDPTRAYGINDNGVIVGDYENSSGVFEGFVYRSGKCTEISFPGSTATYPRGINKTGEIAGFYGDEDNVAHGFVLKGSTYTTVDYPGAGWTFLYHLNDSGQIAGFYQAAAGPLTGPYSGLVATPKTAAGAGGDAKTRGYFITSFTPASGTPGTTVTIYATGALSQTYWLKFNGAYSNGIKVISNTEVTATVPSGATTGPISITLTDPNGEVLVSPTNFTVIP